jgi:integrase
MAYVVARKKRYTGYYRNKNNQVKSVGTFSSRSKALSYALLAEEEGTPNSIPELQETFKVYVERISQSSELRVITRKHYLTLLKKYAVPTLGNKRITAINKQDIKQLLKKLQSEGQSPSTISHLKTALGSLFSKAVDDEVIQTNPVNNIRTTISKPDPLPSLSANEFKKILKNLPNDNARLFARYLVGSGCLYGEATELRVKDINYASKEVFIRRTVSDVGKDFNNGSRFLVVSATKNNHKRTVVLSEGLIADLKAFIKANALAKEDLLFSKELVNNRGTISVPTKAVGEAYAVGSRTFQHATPYSYNVGGCRCELCKYAISQYRSHYRKDKAKGKAESQSHSQSQSNSQSQGHSQSHLPRDKWRTIWNEAITKSGIGWYPRTHDLRHANATQLLKSGVDVHEVKERLGHQSITTTERYLHRVRHQQSKASELVNDYLE